MKAYNAKTIFRREKFSNSIPIQKMKIIFLTIRMIYKILIKKTLLASSGLMMKILNSIIWFKNMENDAGNKSHNPFLAKLTFNVCIDGQKY